VLQTGPRTAPEHSPGTGVGGGWQAENRAANEGKGMKMPPHFFCSYKGKEEVRKRPRVPAMAPRRLMQLRCCMTCGTPWQSHRRMICGWHSSLFVFFKNRVRSVEG
jgi:hypothetical protein